MLSFLSSFSQSSNYDIQFKILGIKTLSIIVSKLFDGI